MRTRNNLAIRRALIAGTAAVTAIALTSCAGLSQFGEQLSQAWKGVPATFTTYDQRGAAVDEVHGVSFRVARDSRFDVTTTDSEGKTSSKPGDVLMISVGDNHISHVGSSACLVQDGLTKVGDAATLKTDSFDPGTPFLNDIFEKFRNNWRGKSKTIMIRSQDGLPISVYAGNAVEVFATDVPKSTWFRVDGKMLWCYRVDYTVYDNALIK